MTYSNSYKNYIYYYIFLNQYKKCQYTQQCNKDGTSDNHSRVFRVQNEIRDRHGDLHTEHEECHEAMQISIHVNDENVVSSQDQKDRPREHDREREAERESSVEDFSGVQILRAEIIVRHTER